MRYAFPTLIVCVFFMAGVSACLYKEWNQAVYSFSAAVLNFVMYFRPFH
jgi:hypothetical protein